MTNHIMTICWLCARPLGRKVEYHHPLPKSKKGRVTVPVHPICHRNIHAIFSNKELERLYPVGEKPAGENDDIYPDPTPLKKQPDMAKFLRWIAKKPPDFHAKTRKKRR